MESVRFTDANLSAVLAAVGKRYVPGNIDHRRLQLRICEVLDFYGARHEMTKRRSRQGMVAATLPKARALDKQVSQIRAQSALRQILAKAAKETADPIVGYTMFGVPITRSVALEEKDEKEKVHEAVEREFLDLHEDIAVDRILAAIYVFRTWCEHVHSSERAPKQRRPDFDLIGRALPKIYQKFFKRKYGASKKADGRATGPGLRFVDAVLRQAGVRNQLGDHYSLETIATYWRLAKRARSKLPASG